MDLQYPLVGYVSFLGLLVVTVEREEHRTEVKWPCTIFSLLHSFGENLSHLVSLVFSYFICKIWKIISISQSCL